MTLSFPIFDANLNDTAGARIYGAVIGIVSNNEDPDGMGRVKLKFPWLSEKDESDWARVAAPMAGINRGIYFLPEVNDEVLVLFEQGDLNFPYVIGALWNGVDKPPVKNDGGENNVRLIKSRSGHCIRLTDENGKEKIEIEDKKGNKIMIDTASNTITINAETDLKLNAEQGQITLAAKTIVLDSKSTLELKAASDAKLEASGKLEVKGSVVNIN
jgi:uncharacterized protein involved in type VI secretion and phage assembly